MIYNISNSLRAKQKLNNKGFAHLGLVLLVLVLAVVGGAGVYVYHANHKLKIVPTTSNNPTSPTQSSTMPTPAPATDPYAGWTTYTSATEKLSFKYPADWTAAKSNNSTQVEGADSVSLKSPSGKVSVQWYSSVEGIGGACSIYILPGTTPKPGDLSPCPYFTVLHKQKLAKADLYYVDGVVEQGDGKAYSAWCGLQSSDGIVKSESNKGYMLFKAKNTFAGTNNANRSGPYQAELACGSSFGGSVGSPGSKTQATAFLSTPDMQKIKLILLSASY